MFGFTSFSNAFETIGQLVAPVGDAEHADGIEGSTPENHEGSGSFEDEIMSFIHKKRLSDASSMSGRDINEPQSPGSLVDVALDDDPPPPRLAPMLPLVTPKRQESNNSSISSSTDYSPNSSFSFGAQFVSNQELEKKVQSKYREQLEAELTAAQRRQQQLEDSVCQLQQECAAWKEQKAAAECAQCPRLLAQLRAAANENSQLVEKMTAADEAWRDKVASNERDYQQKLLAADAALGDCQAQRSEALNRADELQQQLIAQQEVLLESKRSNELFKQQILDGPAAPSTSDDGDGLRAALQSAKQEAQKALAEVARYELALLESEELLKTAEQAAWTAKAEAAECISAMEFDQRKLSEAQALILSLQEQLRDVPPASPVPAVVDLQAFLQHPAVLALRGSVASNSSESVVDASSCLSYAAGLFEAVTVRMTQLQQQVLVAEKERDAARMAQSQSQQSQLETADLADQLTALRASMVKTDNENRQLHQVIQQLRQSRKQQNGEAESALVEVVQLRAQNQQYQQELQELRLKLVNFNELALSHGDLSARSADLEQQVNRLEGAYHDAKRYLLSKEKECSDLKAKHDVMISELRMLQLDNSQRTLEIDNLRAALSSTESDYHHLQLQHKKQLADSSLVHADLLQQIKQSNSAQVQDAMREMQTKLASAEQHAQDQELLCRQAQWEFQKEKQRLQQSLQDVINQLQNSSKDVIDRALVANLVVSYFQRKRAREVLELIAKVLGFNEDQLVTVGLRVPPINLFASLLQTVIGPPTPVAVEGENLAELWVNFLLTQSDEKSSKAGSVPPSPRAAAAVAMKGDS